MGRQDLTRPDASATPGLGESRSRVLAVLQQATAPLAVGEVATSVGLHANTTRFHLDALVDDGLAERTAENRDVPGRPRMLYAATPDSPTAGRRSYRLLAEILTSYVAGQSKPGQVAASAGEAWGRYLAERPAPFRRIDAAAATQQLVTVLDEIGFEPEAVVTGRRRRVLLHHCPFREAAEDHRDVVCSLHLGLMRGLLDELGAPLTAERLDPFVDPGLCVAHLVARARTAG